MFFGPMVHPKQIITPTAADYFIKKCEKKENLRMKTALRKGTLKAKIDTAGGKAMMREKKNY